MFVLTVQVSYSLTLFVGAPIYCWYNDCCAGKNNGHYN